MPLGVPLTRTSCAVARRCLTRREALPRPAAACHACRMGGSLDPLLPASHADLLEGAHDALGIVASLGAG